MKLTLKHMDIRSTNVVDTFVEERILSLQDRLQIDEANVRLEHRRETSPAFRVHIHLVTPGPDLLAEGEDHTIRAAIDKVITQLEGKINHRGFKRAQRSMANLRTPATMRARGN